jgi:hypothetical protein
MLTEYRENLKFIIQISSAAIHHQCIPINLYKNKMIFIINQINVFIKMIHYIIMIPCGRCYSPNQKYLKIIFKIINNNKIKCGIY